MPEVIHLKRQRQVAGHAACSALWERLLSHVYTHGKACRDQLVASGTEGRRESTSVTHLPPLIWRNTMAYRDSYTDTWVHSDTYGQWIFD